MLIPIRVDDDWSEQVFPAKGKTIFIYFNPCCKIKKRVFNIGSVFFFPAMLCIISNQYIFPDTKQNKTKICNHVVYDDWKKFFPRNKKTIFIYFNQCCKIKTCFSINIGSVFSLQCCVKCNLSTLFPWNRTKTNRIYNYDVYDDRNKSIFTKMIRNKSFSTKQKTSFHLIQPVL